MVQGQISNKFRFVVERSQAKTNYVLVTCPFFCQVTNFDETRSDHFALQKEAADLLKLYSSRAGPMADEAVVNLRPMQMTLVEMGSLCNAVKPFFKDTSLNKQMRDQIENLHRRVSDGIRELNQAWTQTLFLQLFPLV